MYKIYIQTNQYGIVTAINSSAFLPDTTGWVQIDEGDGDKYHHAQGNYFPQPIMTDEGVYRYKLVGGKVVERTAAEIQADIDAIPPPPPDPLVVTQKAATVMFQALAKNDTITEADALDNALMFPLWADNIGQRAEAGSFWRHVDKLYRVNAGQGQGRGTPFKPTGRPIRLHRYFRWPPTQPMSGRTGYSRQGRTTLMLWGIK